MFWRFGGYSAVSAIEALLEKGDFTLEDLLEEADLIQELKQQNTRLVEFLREDKNLESLMHYVVAPRVEETDATGDAETQTSPGADQPSTDDDSNSADQASAGDAVPTATSDDTSSQTSADRTPTIKYSRPRAVSSSSDAKPEDQDPDKKRKQYAYVASEVLSSDTWPIYEALVQNEHLFPEFWQFLKRPSPLDPLQAGYFTKVNGALFDKKTEAMLNMLKRMPSAVQDLLSHVESPMIMDLLLKIIALDRKDGGHGIVEWLYSQDVIPTLVACLSPERNWVVQTAAGEFLKAIITISANASQNDQQCIGPNELTRQFVSRPCVEQMIKYMLGGGNPLVVGVGVVIEVIRKNNSDYDPDVGSDVGTPPTSRDPIYLGTLLRLFAVHIPDFMRLIMKAPCEQNAVSSTFGHNLEPLGFNRFKTCELMAELLHCSNMGLLNEPGAEELIAARDQERHRLRAEGRLYPQYLGDVMSLPADDLTMRSLHHEESRRLEVTNRDDDFEEVESNNYDYVRAEDEMPPPASFMDKDDDDFVDEPLSSPRLHIKDHEMDEDDIPADLSANELPSPAVDESSGISFKDSSVGEISMLESSNQSGLDESSRLAVHEEHDIVDRLEDVTLEEIDTSLQNSSRIDDDDDDKFVEQVEQVEDVNEPTESTTPDVSLELGAPTPQSSVPEAISTDPNVTVTVVPVTTELQPDHIESTTPDVSMTGTDYAEDSSMTLRPEESHVTEPESSLVPEPLAENASATVQESEGDSDVVPDPSIVSEADDDREMSRESLEPMTPEASMLDMKNSSQVSEPENSSAFSTGLGDSRFENSAVQEQSAVHVEDSAANPERSDTPPVDDKQPGPVVGDLLKMQFVEHNVVPTILSFFFAYPWNNFLHNVVYDIVQQVFNGPMDRGFNPTLAISLFKTADITAAIIKGQQTSDESQKATKTRMGYMGHLTLIAEEVVKFSERHVPELLSSAVLDRVMSQGWVDYVDGPLAETRERDNAILGGIRPEDAINARNNQSMDYGPPSLNLSNTGSNALASAGLTGTLDSDIGNGLGAFAISTGTVMSGFADDDEDDETNNDEDVVNEFRAYTDPVNNANASGGFEPPAIPPPPPPQAPLNNPPSRARLQLQARLAMSQKNLSLALAEHGSNQEDDEDDGFGPSHSSIPETDPFADDGEGIDDLSDDEDAGMTSQGWPSQDRGAWWRNQLQNDNDGSDSDDMGDDEEFGDFAMAEADNESSPATTAGPSSVASSNAEGGGHKLSILKPLPVHPQMGTTSLGPKSGLSSLWPFNHSFASGSSNAGSGSSSTQHIEGVSEGNEQTGGTGQGSGSVNDEVFVTGEDGKKVSRAVEAKRRTSIEEPDEEEVVV